MAKKNLSPRRNSSGGDKNGAAAKKDKTAAAAAVVEEKKPVKPIAVVKVKEAEEQKVMDTEDSGDESESVYDSGAEEYDESASEADSDGDDDGEEGDDDDDDSDVDDDEEFEDQGSSSDEDDAPEDDDDDDDSSSEGGLEVLGDDAGAKFDFDYESKPRRFGASKTKAKRTIRGAVVAKQKAGEESKGDDGELKPLNPAMEQKRSEFMHTDDLSSDDEDAEGINNRIGAVPLHWYDEYDHMGYNVHGGKVVKSTKGKTNLIENALNHADNKDGVTTVYDALNDKEVVLDDRQLELVRRIQSGTYAHPEHEAHPDQVAYFSGVDPEVSGFNTSSHLPKRHFQPSKAEGIMVRDMLKKLERGHITLDYLKGKIKDMNELNQKKQHNSDNPSQMWDGTEVDEIAMRKGPMQLVAPKVAPPGHAESYNPSEEYLPTDEELKEWEELDTQDRPHGLMVPKKFPNLRSVGAYEHSVRETFERCLNLYLAPRSMKRRLNIDPESLVPSVPKANDLRPFPTTQCVRYETPYNEDAEDAAAPLIRCLSVSPDGQYMASGASDGYVRLWEVSTGRLLKSWNVSQMATEIEKEKKATKPEEEEEKKEETEAAATPSIVIKPVVSLQWNPHKSHHCLIVAVGRLVVLIATGTGGISDAQVTDALLSKAASYDASSAPEKTTTSDESGDKNTKKQPNHITDAVQWMSLVKRATKHEKTISAFGGFSGAVAALYCPKGEVTCVKWHGRGDYFLSVSPKASGGASTLIHRISTAHSQQPFKKQLKGGSASETQCACFHPVKPFLFVASKQHIRIYHLIQQKMVKRLTAGCKWISSLEVHPSGDHVIAGSLDRKSVWFDLDLSDRPYKSFKYHTKAVRAVGFSPRYPLFATSSDDGTTHVFHGMVYSDFVRNPLLVPVKILKGHHKISTKQKLGVLAMVFHPTQPWLFTAGADGVIHLMQDI